MSSRYKPVKAKQTYNKYFFMRFSKFYNFFQLNSVTVLYLYPVVYYTYMGQDTLTEFKKYIFINSLVLLKKKLSELHSI